MLTRSLCNKPARGLETYVSGLRRSSNGTEDPECNMAHDYERQSVCKDRPESTSYCPEYDKWCDDDEPDCSKDVAVEGPCSLPGYASPVVHDVIRLGLWLITRVCISGRAQ